MQKKFRGLMEVNAWPEGETFFHFGRVFALELAELLGLQDHLTDLGDSQDGLIALLGCHPIQVMHHDGALWGMATLPGHKVTDVRMPPPFSRNGHAPCVWPDLDPREDDFPRQEEWDPAVLALLATTTVNRLAMALVDGKDSLPALYSALGGDLVPPTFWAPNVPPQWRARRNVAWVYKETIGGGSGGFDIMLRKPDDLTGKIAQVKVDMRGRYPILRSDGSVAVESRYTDTRLFVAGSVASGRPGIFAGGLRFSQNPICNVHQGGGVGGVFATADPAACAAEWNARIVRDWKRIAPRVLALRDAMSREPGLQFPGLGAPNLALRPKFVGTADLRHIESEWLPKLLAALWNVYQTKLMSGAGVPWWASVSPWEPETLGVFGLDMAFPE